MAITLTCAVVSGVTALTLARGGNEGTVARSAGPTPWPSSTPSAPFEIVRADPDADVSSDDWAKMRATDGSFAFYGPVPSTIVPIDPAQAADGAWKVMFVGSEPECFLYVFDFPARIGQPHAYAERVLRSWVRDSGRRVGPFTSTRQGPVDGWSVNYRWASSSWGEIRAVVGDDRLYEFGCRAGDQRSVEDGRRFTDSFAPTV